MSQTVTMTSASNWDPISGADADSAGRAHSRLLRLMRRDPLVTMLAYTSLADAIFSPVGLGQDSLPEAFDEASMVMSVHRVLDMSPLQVLGGEFRAHLANLVAVAILGRDSRPDVLRNLGLSAPGKD